MKQSWRAWIWAGLALSLYMGGLIMIGILGSQDLWGWGEARGIGYLAFGIGIVASVCGVLIMRILRNRSLV